MTPKTTQQVAPPKPVQRRLLIPLVTVLILLVVEFGTLLTTQYRSHQRQTSKNVLSESVEELDETREEQSATLAALEDIILRDEGLPSALAAGDRERLLADWQPTYEKLRQEYGITHFYFHGPDRVNLPLHFGFDAFCELTIVYLLLSAQKIQKFGQGDEP